MSTLRPRAAWIASAISFEVTEPNSLPSSPARWLMVSTVFASSAAVSSARSAAWRSSSASARSRRGAASSSAPLVAGWASLRGIEVVAQVAGRDVDRVAGLAEPLDVLEQDCLGHQRSPT